jgi:iodotyrosine deiodinase
MILSISASWETIEPTVGYRMRMSTERTIPLEFQRRDPVELATRAAEFLDVISKRRTVRDFSDRPVDREVMLTAIAAAGRAPSGANLQPWHFVLVGNPKVKREIRIAAEEEERAFYEERAPEEWLADLEPLGTDPNKPFLESAPWLVAIFARRWTPRPDGSKRTHYYVPESVGIATGFLIAALHHAGLATLTHTPSPMGFLNSILGRPPEEKPFLLLVVGHPAEDARVPDIGKLPLEEIVNVLD